MSGRAAPYRLRRYGSGMAGEPFTCECGHADRQHSNDTRERCLVAGCGCEVFLHDEESWHRLAAHMAGRGDELLDAVERSLATPADAA
jgi:hypothetical protein